MRGTRILSIIAAFGVGLAVCSPAAAGAVPRGVLSQAEYQEFLNTAQAEAHLGHQAITQVAQRDCSGLTNISALTKAEHAECEASFVFFYRFVDFTTVFAACDKDATELAGRRCLERATTTFSRSTNRFLTTDRSSKNAALQRGFGGECLAYLILTPPQKSAMNKLASGLHSLYRALVIGNPMALLTASEKFSTDTTLARKALFVSGTVKVCRHE